ncbi:MAG: DNA mismatch repair protein MutS [Spirochaetaceae bacterium]|jgi:DNA mismatch repair protein MutS|nr:DNA mismatch repair protein MutS [Spirochaetaceae bacterium]
MLDQYRRIKREHQGDILFFRLGDFYEMFSDDAIEVSALLNLTLTSRNGIPMCGVPWHSSRSYIARLLRLGKKIAICEQVSAPGQGKVIERKVIEVITPGTTIDEDFLDKGKSNHLAALSVRGEFADALFSFAYIDLSTGEFFATSFPHDGAAERLRMELERLDTSEMIVQESLLEENPGLEKAVRDRGGIVVNRWADWLFDAERSRERLENQFGREALAGFGIREKAAELLSAGALLDYVGDTAGNLLPHVRKLTLYGDRDYVGIDEATGRNLELVRNQRDGGERYSLLEVMDETRTGMGRRLLKRRLLHPLRDTARINARLDMVETLYRSQGYLTLFRELLGKCPDLERLCSRLAMDKAHGRDLLSVRNALTSLFTVMEKSAELGLRFADNALVTGSAIPDDNGISDGEDPSDGAPHEPSAHGGLSALDALQKLRATLEAGIAEDPSVLLTEGNLIRAGYSAELDRLRLLKNDGSKLLQAYLEEERARTGITTLKIKYNRIIGYFFEVTKAHLSRVPGYFIRRQGMSGVERYSTEKLGQLESEINSASDLIIALERQIFLEIRDGAKRLAPRLAAAAAYLAELDAAQSLARAATARGWVRPSVGDHLSLRIIEGRHPVVEAHLNAREFIPNDAILDGGGIAFVLITGPNMAGKSTYLRQAALITVMAQMGSFVPAREADIGIADRIYCRVGASDNLARGESTFLAEMNETAWILNTATEKSLVIMDEVGRGTGTEDGLSIAWAVCEELLERTRCRTLFATHYHELARLEHPRLVNRSMEVLERGGEIVFLRRLREGPSENSYGIHVARLAGIPVHVISRAAALMAAFTGRGAFPYTLSQTDAGPPPPGVPDAVSAAAPHAFVAELMETDLDRLTPLDALNLLQDWQRRLQEGSSGPRPDRKKRRPPAPSRDASYGLFD